MSTNPTMARLLPFIEQAAAAIEADRLATQQLADAAREAMGSQTCEQAYQAGRQEGRREERARVLAILDEAREWGWADATDALRRAIEEGQ